MSALRYVVVEISPKGLSLAWGPFSGPEADDWVRDRKLARPDWTFTIDSLRTPIGCATRREQTRETYRKNSAAAIIEAGSRSWEKRWPGERR